MAPADAVRLVFNWDRDGTPVPDRWKYLVNFPCARTHRPIHTVPVLWAPYRTAPHRPYVLGERQRSLARQTRAIAHPNADGTWEGAGPGAVVLSGGCPRITARPPTSELHAAQEARGLAEARYLDGHPALFRDGSQAWDAQVHDTERLVVMAERLAELDGIDALELDFEAAVAARVPAVLADLVEPAKVTALEKLGEGERAVRIATAWLRARAEGPIES